MPLTMAKKKNYEFMSKFHKFVWSSLEFLMNLQDYGYFLTYLTKFTLIWKPISDSSFEFQCLNQIHSNTKFEQNMDQFNLNRIWNEFYLK
jgi:hypothetical protein